MRVAMGMAMNEKNKTEWTLRFYEVLSNMLYTPSTPTLFHSGTPKPQLSSCYLNTVGDSLENIFKTYSDNSQLSKWSGGIGTDWTSVRGTGAFIKGTGVESQGVVPFLKITNDVTVAINRSGRRRGAVCAYLETWHIDIEDFLDLRKNTGDERRRTHDMNTANWIPDLFMQRVREDGNWTLFSPDETKDLHDLYGTPFRKKYEQYEQMVAEGKIRIFKTMKAKDLYKKMITMIFETGHPWFTFKDPCNLRSPQDHVGVIHNSNLCTEITLNTYTSRNSDSKTN
jgi:ribonucleoside-diphosphate reductase alpha chain